MIHSATWKRRARPVAAALLGATFVAALGAPALAQTLASSAAKSFAADYFTAFNPVTAEDMVRRVPGFTLDNGEDRRGFGGAAGNVLINGERPSSKTPLSEQLARIAARDVLSVDLYSGGLDGADLRGQTLLVDVRLRPRVTGSTNTFVVQAGLLDPSGSINPVLSVTSAFKLSDANASIALQAQPSRRGRIEYEKRLESSSGALIERGNEFLQGDYWEYKLSGRVGWKPGPRDTLNLNAKVIPSRDSRKTYSETYNATGVQIRTENSQVVGDKVWAGELGGDWEHRFSPQTHFKLIGLSSRHETGSNERYTVRPAVGTQRDTLVQRSSKSGENVGRGVFTWKPSDSHAIDFGGEVAFNYLDSALHIAVDVGAGPVPSIIPVAVTRVEELRGEVYVTDFWQISRVLKLETNLTLEDSRISQSGDASQRRPFNFIKPRVNLTWSPNGQNQWRFLFERDVAQLNFTEFASAVSLFDGTSDLGNPNLEPERTWRTQIEWERRFGPKTVVTLSAFHDSVDAVQDQIPIAGQFDGPGNIGKGTRTGLRADITTPLDVVGVSRGELRITGQIQGTKAEDPTTGLSRRFSGETEWNYSIDFLQPLPQFKLLWGVLYERADSVQLFRLKELRTTQWQQPNIDVFAETTAIKGLVIRFTVADVLLPTEARERRFYTPDRSLPTNLTSIETRRAKGGYGTRSYTVRVSGRF